MLVNENEYIIYFLINILKNCKSIQINKLCTQNNKN